MSWIQTWSSDWPVVAAWAGAFAAGALSWSFVEYAIHGLLAHRFRTFVSPLHWGHHRTPAAVFTSPLAWLPVALVLFGVGAAVAGAAASAAFLAGLLLGFARYEVVHWRIHFRSPRNAREERRRDHHLAHHFVNPRAYHGVTTRVWDHVFGTLPGGWRDDYARVSGKPPLRAPSNLRATWNPRAALRVLASARHRNPIDVSRE
jgi:sterol desaturase/sphingolipid hydroxylase (fatty acid hydroxylase superfamily)